MATRIWVIFYMLMANFRRNYLATAATRPSGHVFYIRMVSHNVAFPSTLSEYDRVIYTLYALYIAYFA